ncbi:MAG: 16S rRNA (cytosine(1402)-N(4))-methyltransferase RsmH [Candidatus Staskawiczbacteria bacterium]|nr:16S rRNA (cytosine(1402)-N(4))-methyltransferase RsmH [Candidatus Staskawiczbacteria bacterium]
MHIPVLKKEVLEYLNPKTGENFIDCTIGEAGHSSEILERSSPNGKLLGIDLDKSQVERSNNSLADYKNRIIIVEDSYKNIKQIVEDKKFEKVDGILLDAGFSSRHIDDSGRGFSFRKDEPLDMRYSLDNDLTAEKIVNEYPEEEIEKILKYFGEEKFSRQISKNIVKARQAKRIKSTFELSDIIAGAIPMFAKNKHRGLSIWAKAQIGARSFQALRIAVNNELDSLEKFLPDALEVLETGGRLVVISFHSLEDRIVKNFFQENKKLNKLEILTKKPIVATDSEILENPRSRSAKLRAIIKI